MPTIADIMGAPRKPKTTIGSLMGQPSPAAVEFERQRAESAARDAERAAQQEAAWADQLTRDRRRAAMQAEIDAETQEREAEAAGHWATRDALDRQPPDTVSLLGGRRVVDSINAPFNEKLVEAVRSPVNENVVDSVRSPVNEKLEDSLLSPVNEGVIDWLFRRTEPTLDAETKAERIAAANRQMEAIGDALSGQTRALGQGATFGTADELVAAADATLAELDEDDARSWRERYGERLEHERERLRAFREENPALATGMEIAGAVPTALATAPASIARAAVPAGQTLMGRLARPFVGSSAGPMVSQSMRRPALPYRVAKGAAGGGASAGAYGFAQGEDDLESRLESAALPAAVGAGAGAAAPLAGIAGRTIGEWRATGKAAKAGDVPRETVDPMKDMLEVDTGFGNRAIDLPPGATVADAGPAMRSLLDKALATTGKAAGPARREIDRRARVASESMRTALDDTLGTPKGLKTIENKVRGKADPLDAVFGSGRGGGSVRGGYDAAYATPIDYSKNSGVEIMRFLQEQVPMKALREANAAMRRRGERSRQIIATIGDDGTVNYDVLPDVRQIDYITRALNQVAETQRGKGAMGKQTPKGRDFEMLSSEIRGLLKENVPAYGEALARAADPIRARQASILGRDALRSGMTMDEFADALRTFPEGSMERRFVAQGMRDHIDEIMSRAKDSLIPSPNVSGYVSRPASADIEGVLALKQLSSRNARTKIEAVIGERKANELFDALDDTAAAFELKNTMLLNLRKLADKSIGTQIARTEAGAIEAIRRGDPVKGAQRAAAALMGRGPTSEALRNDATSEALVNTLLREADAGRLNALARAERKEPAGQRMARVFEVLFGRTPIAATGALPDEFTVSP